MKFFKTLHTRTFIIATLLFLQSDVIMAQVTVQKIDSTWQLLVDNKPYEVKGVTFGYDENVKQYDSYFEELRFLGVNTIRTWATGEYTPQLLDAAHEHGIKVMVGIWMRHGRPGMEDDDRFDYINDEEGKNDMMQNAIQVVETFKDHPAVLTWGIGNEVYLNMETDEEKRVYSELLEQICSKIKKLDPDHPVTSVEAWTFGMDWWKQYVPSLDIYGLNSYGAGANFLQTELNKRGIDKPYLITEFGVTGEWDIRDEVNGVTVEPSDQEKYTTIVEGYRNWIINKPSNLGVFVFHYADGDNFAAPWLHTHVQGKKRPAYWAVREAYTGKKPLNAVPDIEPFSLPTRTIKGGRWLDLDLDIKDRDGDELEVSFGYNQRTGSRKRRNQILPLQHTGSLSEGFNIELPKEDGPVKIYAFATDSYGNMGIASAGIQLRDKKARNRKCLVPKVDLPFYVYQDDRNSPYAPSAYMGDHTAMNVVTNHNTDVYRGENAIKITFQKDYGWYGFGLVDPVHDWGDVIGGYDISGASRFSFWAKTNRDKVTAMAGFGLIDDDKPYPDSEITSKEIILANTWRKYSIDTSNMDLHCIRTGFAIFSSTSGQDHEIYIDDIMFE